MRTPAPINRPWRNNYLRWLLAAALASPGIVCAQPSITPRFKQGPNNPFVLDSIAAQGRIVPNGGVVRLAAPAGPQGPAIISKLLVKTGDWVEPNQLLAVLLSQPVLQAECDAAEREQAVAAAALSQAQAAQTHTLAEFQAQIVELEGLANIADANARRAAVDSQLALELAKREESTATAALESLRNLKATVLAATASAVTVAQTQVNVIPAGRPEHKIADSQLEQAKAVEQRANLEFIAQLDTLQAKVDLAVIQTHLAEAAVVRDPVAGEAAPLAPVQAQARAAHANLDARRQLLASLQAEGAAMVVAAQARLTSATASLVAARAALSLGEIHATTAGRVLAINVHPGEIVGVTGVLDLGDTREMFVDAQVYVDQVRRVKKGQKVVVSGPALPEDTYLNGQVVEVSDLVASNTAPSLDPAAFSDQPVVLVKVRLEVPEAAANLINAQVKVRIEP